VSGKVTSKDFDTLAGPLGAFVKEHDKINLMESIENF
jgi:hypothetical protein